MAITVDVPKFTCLGVQSKNVSLQRPVPLNGHFTSTATSLQRSLRYNVRLSTTAISCLQGGLIAKMFSEKAIDC